MTSPSTPDRAVRNPSSMAMQKPAARAPTRLNIEPRRGPPSLRRTWGATEVTSRLGTEVTGSSTRVMSAVTLCARPGPGDHCGGREVDDQGHGEQGQSRCHQGGDAELGRLADQVGDQEGP